VTPPSQQQGTEYLLQMQKQDEIILDVSFSSLRNELSAKNIELVPFKENTEFVKYFAHQVSWMNLKKGDLDISGLNLNEALLGNLVAEKITISETDLEVYRDKNFPLNEENAPLLPMSALKEVPIKIIVDSVEINNSTINYREFLD